VRRKTEFDACFQPKKNGCGRSPFLLGSDFEYPLPTLLELSGYRNEDWKASQTVQCTAELLGGGGYQASSLTNGFNRVLENSKTSVFAEYTREDSNL